MKFPWLPNSPNSLASNGPSDSTMPLLPKQQLKRRSCLCLWCDLHSTIDDPMGQVNHENACLVSSATARTWQCASLGTVHIFAYQVIPLESSVNQKVQQFNMFQQCFTHMLHLHYLIILITIQSILPLRSSTTSVTTGAKR